MLADNLSAAVDIERWQELSNRAELPCTEDDYFGTAGASPTSPDSRRSYRRIRIRGRLVVRRGSESLGAYTIDVSPAGVGFYSPVQLYPKERVTVIFDGYGDLELQISRCRRIRKQCYACGGTFIEGKMTPGTYREFLRYFKV
jgi:hypothetical protein